MPDPQAIIAYTDGSCSAWNADKPESNRASWGLAIQRGEKTIHESAGEVHGPVDLLRMRNVAGELKAAMEAVRWARAQRQPVHLCFDYNGVEYWATGRWRRKNTFTRAYHEFMSINQRWILSFIFTRGHTGVPGNDRADALAGAVLKDADA